MNNAFTGATKTDSVFFGNFIVAPFGGCSRGIRSIRYIPQCFA